MECLTACVSKEDYASNADCSGVRAVAQKTSALNSAVLYSARRGVRVQLEARCTTVCVLVTF